MSDQSYIRFHYQKRQSYGGGALTLTFGECAENHVGMQKVGGALADQGFSLEDLKSFQAHFEARNFVCQWVNLNQAVEDQKIETEPAAVLVIRDGVEAVCGADQIWTEQVNLDWDRQAWMRGRVVNKKARWNLCYSEEGQEPNYPEKRGWIIPYSEVPYTAAVRQAVRCFFDDIGGEVETEGNYYYDVTKCGIGFHGDSERKRVVALRLGQTVPLEYQWFQNGLPIGQRVSISLGHGDMYFMSEKATGFDWKKRLKPTLRHAAGCQKFLTIEKKRAK